MKWIKKNWLVLMIIGLITYLVYTLFGAKIKAAFKPPVAPAVNNTSSGSNTSSSTPKPPPVAAYQPKKGDTVLIAKGSHGVNIRMSPGTSSTVAYTSSEGTILGTYDSTVSSGGINWIKFHPAGPVLNSTFYYVASMYASFTPAVVDTGFIDQLLGIYKF